MGSSLVGLEEFRFWGSRFRANISGLKFAVEGFEGFGVSSGGFRGGLGFRVSGSRFMFHGERSRVMKGSAFCVKGFVS